MRKKRIILWAVVLAVAMVAAGLYPVISKQMKTPRVTWFLEAPTGTEIQAASPNGRFFVAADKRQTYVAKEGDKKWTELPGNFESGKILVSDLGTVLIQKIPPKDSSMLGDWYWFQAGKEGVPIDPKTLPRPKEFLEESDDWVAICDDSKETVGVFDLSGSLLRPIVSPDKMKLGLNKNLKLRWYYLAISKFHTGLWEHGSYESRISRNFVRIGTKFEERKAPPISSFGVAVSDDGHWVAVMDIGESRVYKDGVLKERLSFTNPPMSTGLDALRDLFNQYVLRHPKVEVLRMDIISGFELNGKRRVGTVVSENTTSEGYVQVDGDRFYAPELGLPPKGDKEEFRMFLYISPDGRRIIGSQGSGLFVFAIDR